MIEVGNSKKHARAPEHMVYSHHYGTEHGNPTARRQDETIWSDDRTQLDGDICQHGTAERLEIHRGSPPVMIHTATSSQPDSDASPATHKC